MYECYECGVDRGGSGMREDGNCIDCGPVTKKKLKRRVEELIEAHDRLAAENAELKARYLHVAELNHNQVSMVRADRAALAAANATLDALREAVPERLADTHIIAAGELKPILYPQPAALAEEKTNGPE